MSPRPCQLRRQRPSNSAMKSLSGSQSQPRTACGPPAQLAQIVPIAAVAIGRLEVLAEMVRPVVVAVAEAVADDQDSQLPVLAEVLGLGLEGRRQRSALLEALQRIAGVPGGRAVDRRRGLAALGHGDGRCDDQSSNIMVAIVRMGFPSSSVLPGFGHGNNARQVDCGSLRDGPSIIAIGNARCHCDDLRRSAAGHDPLSHLLAAANALWYVHLKTFESRKGETP